MPVPNLSDAMKRLTAFRSGSQIQGSVISGTRLTELTDFGSNPGTLKAHIYVPQSCNEASPLVVILHGCTQTAAGYDVGAGWSEMADRHGFLLLFPEQQRQNNPNLCFNWFNLADSRRDSGEALSIRQAIAAVVDAYNIDSRRIFVTGLSAGGAMATVMLATYPDVFASGAIIAGLPYGCARSVPEALARMQGNGVPTDAELLRIARDASNHLGPWPTVSIWHGSEDATVNPCNGEAVIGQWRALHQTAVEPSRLEVIEGYQRRVWCDEGGRDVVEAYTIAGLGHGTPLNTLSQDGCGKASAFMLEAGVCSTSRICRFWGLIPAADNASYSNAGLVPPMPVSIQSDANSLPLRLRSQRSSYESLQTGRVGKVIEEALRAAGLMH